MSLEAFDLAAWSGWSSGGRVEGFEDDCTGIGGTWGILQA